LKKLAGNRDIEDSLERLDKLTQEEARMASSELLKMTQSVDSKVMGVDDRVKGVRDDVRDLQDVGRDISISVQGVDDKLNQANRSLFL
jgi:hypothetical protein